MNRLLVLACAGLAAVAFAGAIGLPDLAGAQDPAAERDTLTVAGVGSVFAVPDQAELSFGVETRRPTARAAVAATAEAARQVVAALRRAGARELATQWVSVWPVTGENGAIEGYAASSTVSALADASDAAALIDTAVEAGANQVSGPGLSPSNAEELHRRALEKAVSVARERAQALARAAGRGLGRIVAVAEASAAPVPYADRAVGGDAAAASVPIVPGRQEITATVTVTFELR